MPLAKKFRAMMDFPFPGDTMGNFIVESVDVYVVKEDKGGIVYGVRMALSGPGKVQNVQQAIKALFSQHPTTFSGFGNPYQLWFMKPEIESLGEQRYAVTVHKQPGGALCIVPVHSQHRGRLFLPFVDNDPKTAEVLSKAILLARDNEIKDPTILEQILH